jgi:hypothetical protein
LVKSADRIAAHRTVHATLQRMEGRSSRGLKFEIDVDPLELV